MDEFARYMDSPTLGDYFAEFSAAERPTQPSQANLSRMSIGPLQAILNKLGEKVGSDGLFGPTTKGAWARQAQKYGRSPAFDRAAPTEAWVSMDTYTALSAAAYPAAKPAAAKPATKKAGAKAKPASKPAATTPGTVVRPVLELQDLLFGVGWTTKKLKRDGLYGPTTKGAWATSAKSRKLPELFERVDGQTARVSQATYARIKSDGVTSAAQKTVSPAVTPAAPAAAIVAATPAGTVVRTVLELQDLLFGVGWTTKKLTRDGLYGPNTKKAWGVSAKLRKLPELFERVDGKNARVSQATYDKIKADGKGVSTPEKAVEKKEEAKKPSTPTGLLDKPVAELQGILYGVGWTTKKLKSDGLFGAQTKNAWVGSAKLRGLPTTFERVDGRTARVDATTYEALKAKMPATKSDKVEPKPEDKPAPGKPAAPKGMLDKSVAELQGILYGVGWTTKKLKSDGLFGAQTKTAWTTSAKLRGLPTTFERVDGRTARVDATTYEALKAKMPATKVDEKTKKKADKIEAADKVKGPPAGKLDKSVAELQAILYGVGWTTKKLKSDGLFGAQTRNAWAGSAKLRKLPTTFDRVDGRTARVDAVTYEALKSKMPAGGEKAPKIGGSDNAKGLITKPVLEIQKLLQAIGWKARTVPTSGKYDDNTRKAWVQSASKRGLTSTISKVDARTAKVHVGTFNAISDEIKSKKPDTPKKPKPSDLTTAAQQLVKLANQPVSAEKVQQAMALAAMRQNKEPAPITGVWSKQHTVAFFDTLLADLKEKPEIQKVWQEAFPAMVSADGKTINLTANLASAIPALADAWLKSQEEIKPAPIPGPEPYPEPAPAPEPAPGPVPEGPVGPGPGPGGGGGGPAPEPFFDTPSGGGGAEPAPSPEPPAPSPAAEEGSQVWSAAANALENLTKKAPGIEEALAKARARGELHPDVKAAVDAWVSSANKLMGSVADVISGSPELRAALDASGSSVGFAGIRGWGGELAAFFGELEAVAEKAVELLRTPIPAPTSLQGFAQAIPPAAGPIAARVASAAWVRLLQLLRLPVVTAAGATAVGASALKDALGGEVQAYLDHEAALEQLVAEGKLTIEEYNALKKPIPSGPMGPIILGIVALGGLALYLKNKSASGGSGGRHALARR